MKGGGWCLAVLLMAGLSGWAQDAREQTQQPPQRPTLGPQPAPSLYGPRTSTTTDARKLLRIRAIFIERIDNALSEKLADGLTKMGRFRAAATRNEADAVMRGTCSEFRRLKAVRSEVYITDRNGASIWQDSVRRPFNPPSLNQAVDETVLLVLDHLGQSIREAERK